ncbi:HTH_48 domain-containing protein [Trichonephila clavipes]|nr:HTH_48 domain-containing protein [Trichonephila clavipes]
MCYKQEYEIRGVFVNYICWEATDAITELSDRVYICLRDFKRPPPIENRADCEVRAVIRFLCDQGFKSVDIHHQISEVYGENIMSDGMVRKWFSAFKDGRTHIHDEERSGRPSVITDELIQKVDCKVKENR